ncbi:MAG: hemolysin family protein [Saprospiraceae bacterium]
MLFVFIIFFLLLSALFSGTEIAFISASKLRVELKRQKGSRQGTILARFYEEPASFLGAMLVGNNIALVVFTWLMAGVLDPFLERHLGISGPIGLLVQTVLVTFVILIFGEFLPKTLFRLFADEILYFLAYPLAFLRYLLSIPSWFMTKLSNFLLRIIFKTPFDETDNVITRFDLGDFIRDTRTGEYKEEIDSTLFEKALHLQKVKVKECMVPRTEIRDIDATESVEDLKNLFLETNLSRLIVSKEDIDNVLGYVHHQQMMESPDSISNMILDIPIVPEAMKVTDLMNKFIKERLNIALVVDEYGGTAGVITLEDILEQIFGEIEDEHDQEEYVEIQVSDSEWLLSGRLEIGYLNDKYEGLDFTEGDYHTLSGFLVMTTATIPEQGAEIHLHGYRFILELVSETKIETVRVIKVIPDLEDEKVD